MRQLKIGFDLDGVILFWLFFLKKNAREVLISLKEQKHIIKIVTARGKFLLFLAKITLRFYGLGWLEIVGVGPNGRKYEELDGFDIFFDNKVKHLLAIDGRVKHLYIFGKRPANGFQNLSNWLQIYFQIGFLEGSQ